jgi:protein TonB
MVALHRYDDLDPGSGMLAFLRERRAEADAALPKSAALASFGHLTIAVVVLTLSAFLRAGAPEMRVIPIPPYADPTQHPLENPLPFANPGQRAYVPPAVAQPGEILPVNHDTVFDPKTLDPAPPIDPGVGPVGDSQVAPSGAGEGTLPEVIPPPGIYVYREVDPEVTHKVIPDYPAIAKLAAMDGDVTVRVFVGTDGRVRRAEIEGKGNDLFNDAALEAVRQWRFTPALSNNQPVGVWVRIPIHFHING